MSSRDHDRFEQQLSKLLTEQVDYIHDNGFCAGVMAKLDNRSPRLVGRYLSWLITAIGGLFIIAILIVSLPTQPFWPAMMASIKSANPEFWLTLVLSMGGTAMFVASVWWLREIKLI